MKTKLDSDLDWADKLLTTEETAKFLSISASTLKVWRVHGHRDGPDFIKIGRGRKARVRYSVATLTAYLRKQTVRLNEGANGNDQKKTL